MQSEKENRLIGYWLILGVAMLMFQVLIGGITRLTGSGLSITEWNPIMGFIPPLNANEWNIAFEKYKGIGQFKYLNQDFSLADFKFIFFWEWFHRFWARFIGIAFIIPFLYFIYMNLITWNIIKHLLGLFLLGVLLASIGWIMVQSGLNDEHLYVSHIKLAIHFVTALILISFTFYYALTFVIPNSERLHHDKLKVSTLWLLFILLVQLCYGAFMAGLKGGAAATTWPTINGDYLPNTLDSKSWVSNTINVHFFHRNLGYLLAIAVLVWSVKAFRVSGNNTWKWFRYAPFLFVLLQVVLGVFTVLNASQIARNGFGTFEYMAQAHQLVAMFLTMSLVWALYMVNRPSSQNSNLNAR